MTKRSTPAAASALPPKPSISLAAIKKRSNSFAEVDRIVADQLGKYPPSDTLAAYMQKAGTDNPAFYARFCIVMASLRAWERAREWKEERPAVRANIAKIVRQIDEVMRANDALKRLAESVAEQKQSLPKAADPTTIAERADYFGDFETLALAANRIETFAYDDLAEVKRKVEARDYGRKDVLEYQFVENLARAWLTLFGEYPPTARSSAFVNLADEAWKAIGWGDRPSLGKKILDIATDKSWSQLKRMDRYLAGTI